METARSSQEESSVPLMAAEGLLIEAEETYRRLACDLRDLAVALKNAGIEPVQAEEVLFGTCADYLETGACALAAASGKLHAASGDDATASPSDREPAVRSRIDRHPPSTSPWERAAFYRGAALGLINMIDRIDQATLDRNVKRVVGDTHPYADVQRGITASYLALAFQQLVQDINF